MAWCTLAAPQKKKETNSHFREETLAQLRLIGKTNLKETLMQQRTFVLSVLVVLLALPILAFETGAYSDPTGIYARVDKVVLEPNATTPERIQIWGAFA